MKHSHKDFHDYKTIKLPMYPYDVTFFLVKPAVAKLYLPSYGRCQVTKDDHIFIYFKHKKPEPGVVAHECFHAVEYIMERIGQKLNDAPNETWSYLLQYLVYECHEFIK